MRMAGTAALLIVFSSVPRGRADAPVPAWTPELAFKVKRVGPVRVSPDGRRVAFVVASAVMEGEKSEWISQVHVARADGESPLQLTAGEKSATAPDWSPDGRWIAFVSARGKAGKDGKDPKPGLWRIRVDGGEAEALTEEKGAVAAPRWSPDGSRIAFLLTDPKTVEEEEAEKEKRDARVVDEDLKRIRLCVVPAEKDAAGKRPVKVLTPGELSVGNVGEPGRYDWSPDGRFIVFAHQPTPQVDDWPKGDVSVVDVASGALRPLAAGGAAESDPFFSPDGRSVALAVSDDPPTWAFASRIAVVPLEGGAPRVLSVTHDQRPDLLGWSADGKRVLFAETRGTVNRVGAAPLDGGPVVDLTPADLMVDQPALDASRTRLGFMSQAPDRAPEAWTSALAPFAPVRVSRVQEPAPASFPRTEVVSWKAPDGRAIEGLLTYPAGYTPGARVPLLVVIHGGPAGVFVRSFTGAVATYPVAVFASRGYALLRCNVRGSSGYGREFRHANQKDWGGGDYQDILAGVDALVARGLADPERLGVMGWSYGGYMTSWIITQTRRFKAASVGAGVTNLMSFSGTADIPSFIPDYFGGEFWDDLEPWRRRSAMFHVKGVTTPTLIQHGEADLRVPVSQGYELYNALKRQGVPTRMVVYPRQPHGIQEPRLQLDAMTRNLEWFDRFVMGAGSADKIATPGGGSR
jgi:dipeptidyl aminopeptidase/acylaminoacyl peptidase